MLGDPCFTVNDVPAELVVKKLPGKAKVPCLICKQKETIALMRSHVGGHILRAQRDPDTVTEDVRTCLCRNLEVAQFTDIAFVDRSRTVRLLR